MHLERFAIGLCALTVAASPASAQKPRVGAGRIAGEVGVGFLGGPVGFAIGYTIGSGFRPHGSSNSGVVGGLTGAVLGPAAGVALVGKGGRSRGSFPAAIGGSALGYGATYLAFPWATKPESMKLKIAGGLIAFALPAIGATIAYNATRK